MRRLRALAGEGRPITTMVFPGTDHGIVAFETGADGKRSETRHAEGYLRMLDDWIGDGRLDHPPYGNAKLLDAPSPERKSVVEGKSVSGRVESGGRRIIKKT